MAMNAVSTTKRTRQDYDVVASSSFTRSLWQSIFGIFLLSQLAIIMVSRHHTIVEVVTVLEDENSISYNRDNNNNKALDNNLRRPADASRRSKPFWPDEEEEMPTAKKQHGALLKRSNSTTLPNMTIKSYNSNTCTSPEIHIPFPLQGNIRISDDDNNNNNNNNHHHPTCGLFLQPHNPFSRYMLELRDEILPSIMDHDCPTIVFGVALGTSFVETIKNATTMDPQRSQSLLQEHGHCFVMFVSENDIENPTLQGHMWLVPIIPQQQHNILPYRNNRRNTKLLKYSGHLLFPSTTPTLIWQDAKFSSKELRNKQPTDYNKGLVQQRSNNNNCLTTFGLPVHPYTMGKWSKLSSKPSFQAHCDTIVKALQQHRPNVTDSMDSVLRQCEMYNDVQQQQQQSSTHNNTLDHAMVDTAFMIWKNQEDCCRDFNAQLRCRLLNEIHCHSDRDQIPWPYVLSEMGLDGYYGGEKKKIVDDHWNPKIQDVEMRYANSTNAMVTILRSNCHWYKNIIGKGGCKYWDDSGRR